MNTQNKRDRLISAAATLFHRKGIVATSLADIAKDADIPIGNVYYYFKTKEELALSAILRHKEQTIARFTTLNETMDDPRQRLKKSLEYYEQMADEFARYGCPIGKIIMDADVDGTITRAAAEVFECSLGWAEMQFRELGYDEDAKSQAIALTSSIQGALILAKATQDAQLLRHELARIAQVVDQIPNKRISLGKVGKAGAA